MLIDSQLLTKLEKLSMLQIENKDNMIDSLTSILDFVENLNELQLDNIKVGNDHPNRHFREDNPISSNVINTIMANAPKTEDNFFIVPKIIE
jgi:aspartyl-tRNA(Asn)/glutamyl-tRNA(Gln) amidotransferase subunit C